MGELVKHKPIMPGKTEKEQIGMIVDMLGTPSEKIWPNFSKLPLAGAFKLEQQPYVA